MAHQFCMIIKHEGIEYSGKANTDTYSEIIRLIIDDYMIFKEYIPNSLCLKNFLNVERCGNWPEWKIGHDYIACNDKYFSNILIMNNIIFVKNVHDSKVENNSKTIIKNPKNQKFIDFINRRFLLKSICKKYNLPKDIQNYLVNFFFKN